MKVIYSDIKNIKQNFIIMKVNKNNMEKEKNNKQFLIDNMILKEK